MIPRYEIKNQQIFKNKHNTKENFEFTHENCKLYSQKYEKRIPFEISDEKNDFIHDRKENNFFLCEATLFINKPFDI